jgi:hypothetical protein
VETSQYAIVISSPTSIGVHNVICSIGGADGRIQKDGTELGRHE